MRARRPQGVKRPLPPQFLGQSNVGGSRWMIFDMEDCRQSTVMAYPKTQVPFILTSIEQPRKRRLFGEDANPQLPNLDSG
eukprot:6183950-Amphidinium_carterae.1